MTDIGAWSSSAAPANAPEGSYRYAVTIRNGIISYGGGDAYLSGRVNAKGGVYVRVSAGGQNAAGSGRLSRNTVEVRGGGSRRMVPAAGAGAQPAWAGESRLRIRRRGSGNDLIEGSPCLRAPPLA